MKPEEINPTGKKPDDFASVWGRKSRRHKWRLQFSFVRIVRLDIDDNHATVQTSTTYKEDERGGWTSCTSFNLYGVGDQTWERQFRDPVFRPVYLMREEGLIK